MGVAIPARDKDISGIYNYLMGRGIARDVIDFFVNNGSINQDTKYMDAIMHHAEGRDWANVFKSPIDLLSYTSLVEEESFKNRSMLSLSEIYEIELESGSKVKLPVGMEEYLERYPDTRVVCIHFDNDEQGHRAAERLKNVLEQRNIHAVREFPPEGFKDMNDYLVGWKKYKKWSRYTDGMNLLVEDFSRVNTDVQIPAYIGLCSVSREQIFPGVDVFKAEALSVLENEFHFQVVEDLYAGRKQKGYIEDRDYSVHVEFDAYYDLRNSEEVIRSWGVENLSIPETRTVYCHFCISFFDDVLYKHGAGNDSKDAGTEMQELNMHYDEAIDDFRLELEFKILSWVRKAERIRLIRE